MKKKVTQKHLAIILLVLAILIGCVLYATHFNFIWYWIFGLVIGFILQHFQICFLSSISEPMITKSTERFRSILLGLLVSSLGITLVKYLSNGSLDMQGVSAITFPLILGAFLFGMGMIIAGCCSIGVFVRIAEGYEIHIITFLCIALGYLVGNQDYSKTWTSLTTPAAVVFLPEKFGWFQGVSIHLAIILGLYMLARAWGSGTSPSNSTLYLKGSLLFGIVNILHYLVFDSGISITGAFYWLVDHSNVTLAHNLRNFGIFFGALFSVLCTKRFKRKKIRSNKQVVTTAVGGLLMGYGARIAGGCNVNAFFNASASLSLSGWIFMLSLFIGTFVGMKLLYRLM